MKTKLILALPICLLAFMPLQGCSRQVPEEAAGIYYKKPPAALTSGLASGLKQLEKAKPLSPQAREQVRQTIVGMDTREFSEGNKSAILALSAIGAPALPIIAESLTSPDDSLRIKGILALPVLERVQPLFTKDYLDNTEPVVVLVGHRSLFDKDSKVRGEAFGVLYRVGRNHPPKGVPKGVMAAMEQAAKDPDEKMRQRAKNAIDRFSGARPDTSCVIP